MQEAIERLGGEIIQSTQTRFGEVAKPHTDDTLISTGKSFGYTPGDDAARNRPVELKERL